MNNIITSNRKTVAWSITIFLHLVLLLIFLLIKYQLPAQVQTQEQPIEIALGTDMDGLGADPDQVMDEPAPTASEEEQAPTPSPNAPNHIDADDNPKLVNPVSVPKTKPNENNKPKVNPNTNLTKTNNKPTNSPSTSNPKAPKGKYEFEGANGPGGNSAAQDKPGSGSGNTSGNGTKGSPGGSPTGNSFGTAYKLSGRNIVRYPNPNAKYNEGGKVTVRVWVNRDGVITDYKITDAPSQALRSIAERKIKEIKFNSSSTALPTQSGTIYFNFATGRK